jgi:hypothetical protein
MRLRAGSPIGRAFVMANNEDKTSAQRQPPEIGDAPPQQAPMRSAPTVSAQNSPDTALPRSAVVSLSEKEIRVRTADEFNHTNALAHRIASASTSIQDAVVLTRIREEIIRQDEDRGDRRYARRSETRQFYAKMIFSAGAVASGAGLIATGHGPEGFVVMGVGLHWLAPDFVTSIWNRFFGKGERANNDEQ